MTATLEGGEWSEARPGRTLPTEKTRYPLYSRLGGPQGRSGRAESLVPTGILIPGSSSRYTDWATGPTSSLWPLLIITLHLVSYDTQLQWRTQAFCWGGFNKFSW